MIIKLKNRPRSKGAVEPAKKRILLENGFILEQYNYWIYGSWFMRGCNTFHWKFLSF
jgi:hypothetical protein